MHKPFIIAALALLLLSADLSAQQFEVLSRIKRTYGDKTVCVSDDGSTVLIVQNSVGFNPQGLSGDGKHFVGYTDWPSSHISSSLYAYDASFDGSVVVGTTIVGTTSVAPVRIANGQTTNLGNLFSDDTGGVARAVSADGRTVVGDSYRQEAIPFGSRKTRSIPFRWTEDLGLTSLGTLPGFSENSIGRANDVSGDGSVIVGEMQDRRFDEAFRWTAETGMQPLGKIYESPTSWSSAEAISADGRWIVGSAANAAKYGSVAVLWDGLNGLQQLPNFLQNEFGIDLQGIHLWNATGISANGRVIVGWGVETTGAQDFVAWRADLGPVVPEPSSLIIATLAITPCLAARRRARRAT